MVAGRAVSSQPSLDGGTGTVAPVRGWRQVAWFRRAGAEPYRDDPCWTPPLPGEMDEPFQVGPGRAARWVLLAGGRPVGRIGAFLPEGRPGTGYFGCFECPDDPIGARQLLAAAEDWLVARGCRECFGPLAGTARDRIGLLTEGFRRAALPFTPYNPAYYPRLLAAAGYAPRVHLRGYGWTPNLADTASVMAPTARGRVRVRPLDPRRLAAETRLVAALVNETMADAWHYAPITPGEADQMARLLRPILDPRIALVAEDEAGPCGVALAVPDINWLWRRAHARPWPLGWLELLRGRRRIPAARMMALGVSRRVRGSAVAVRLIGQLHANGRAAGYASGELTQVFDDNHGMRRILDRLGFPVVRRYAVYHRSLPS